MRQTRTAYGPIRNLLPTLKPCRAPAAERAEWLTTGTKYKNQRPNGSGVDSRACVRVGPVPCPRARFQFQPGGSARWRTPTGGAPSFPRPVPRGPDPRESPVPHPTCPSEAGGKTAVLLIRASGARAVRVTVTVTVTALGATERLRQLLVILS
jgi:hypothetical protein